MSLHVNMSYLGKFKHGFHGRLIFNKVIFHISIISQICKTLYGPVPCFGINLGITKPPRGKKRKELSESVSVVVVIARKRVMIVP